MFRLSHDQDPERIAAELRDLAADTREPDWTAMEARLLDAFSTNPPRATIRRRMPVAIWQPVAAAAVIMLAAAITWYTPGTGRHTPLAPAPPPAPPRAPATPREAPATPMAPATPPSPAQRERSAPVARPQYAAAGEFDDFIALPEAAALPDFESGRIVRVEVPLTALPAYGLDIVPDAAPNAVAADLLVGQDGVPRAIRLASTNIP
jgi:hypothetical protein